MAGAALYMLVQRERMRGVRDGSIAAFVLSATLIAFVALIGLLIAHTWMR